MAIVWRDKYVLYNNVSEEPKIIEIMKEFDNAAKFVAIMHNVGNGNIIKQSLFNFQTETLKPYANDFWENCSFKERSFIKKRDVIRKDNSLNEKEKFDKIEKL